MQFSHTRDDGLSGLLIGIRLEGGIFLRQFNESHGHLFLSGLRLGFERKLNDGFGEYHLFENNGMFFVAERIARRGVFETYNGADIARIDFGNILSLVGVHLDETADSLLLFLRGVIHVGTGGQNAGVSAEIREGADKRVGRDLERKASERFVVRGFSDFLFLRIGVDALDVIDVERAGKEINDGVEQELNALVLIRRPAEHGNCFHFKAARTKSRNDFLFGEVSVFKIFFHQLVAGGSGFLDKLCAVFVRELFQIVGNGLLAVVLAEVVVIDFGFHSDEVDDSAESIFFSDGKFDGHGIRAESFADHSLHAEEIRAVDIHFVDVGDTGNLIGIRLAPYGF